MNANEIWSGQDYAWVQYISRGVTYYNDARPVRVMRVYKETPVGKDRGRTMVEVLMMKEDENGRLTVATRTDGSEITRNVRAREIYARWAEHAQVRNKKREEREEQERERQERRERERREYEEREAIRRAEREAREAVERAEREEKERRQQEENEQIFAWLERRGLKRDNVTVGFNGDILISRDTILRKVGLYGQSIMERTT